MCALASRITDLTVHGGPICMGAFNVLIECLPAARTGDTYLCPMMVPMVPPIPHVMGVLFWPGALTVLIGNQPAARLSDLGQCLAVIPNVQIGCCATVDIGPMAFLPPFPPFIDIPDGTFSGGGPAGVVNYKGLVNYMYGINALVVLNAVGLAIALLVAAAVGAVAAVLVAVAQVLVVPPG
jgi:uncharacterized Zn-binding protein involved in type VI secretion